MKKILTLAFITCSIFVLGAPSCATLSPNLIGTKIVVSEIPAKYLTCAGIKKSEYPDVSKLTDKQVANLLNTYDNRLKHCVNNASAARNYQVKSKKILEK